MHQKSDKKSGQIWLPLAAKPSNIWTQIDIFLESSFHWLSIDVQKIVQLSEFLRIKQKDTPKKLINVDTL